MGIPERKLNSHGAEMTWGVNHLGHFYLTFLLWPKLIKSAFFRIINISSISHHRYLGFFRTINIDFDNINLDRNYDPHLAYSRSKLYNILFAKILATKVDTSKGIAVSVHPGVVRT